MSWRDKAACIGMDTEIFFPPERNQHRFQMAREAKRVCSSCPVQQECLEFDLRMGFEEDQPSARYGIYGGLLPEERKGFRYVPA